MDHDNTRHWDEDEALAFIRKHISEEMSRRYSDDEIVLVVDTILDFYESKGVVSLNKVLTEEEKSHLDRLAAYVRKEIKNDDEILMDPQDVDAIVKAELSYEQSIENHNQ